MKLLTLAKQAMKNAYVPYSNFRVGVSIKSESGKFYKGCNVENAAYPQGLCAEAGAISAMISGGCISIQQVLILSDSKDLIVPCGGCRQKLAEFSNDNTSVFLADQEGVKKVLTLNQLLPHSFNRSFLSGQ